MPYQPPDGPEKYRDEEWLREKYRVEKLSTPEIGELCECSKETIRRWLERHGIGTRSQSEAATIRAESHPHTTEAGAEALREHGVNPWDEWSEEQREAFRERLSQARRGEDNPMYGVTGEEHHHWDPDTEYPTIYHSAEWQRVRKRVYSRDGYTCQLCENPASGPLHAHHEVPVSEGGAPFDVDNLVTVCEACHLAIHHD